MQARLGKVQTFSYGWIADYPDGENFLQLFWGGSIGQANYTYFDLPEFNALYVKAKSMAPSPERDRLYDRMVKLVLVYNPWMVETYKRNIVMLQPWLVGYKKHPFMHEPWRYLDIDLSRAPKR
jgi:ABC-type transport system substrate-binding protein